MDETLSKPFVRVESEMLSMSQAAKIAGVSKATIHRAIKSGRISAERNDDGSYSIDPAELSRAYVANRHDEMHETDHETTQNGRNATSAMVVLAELAGARQLIKSLQEQMADLSKLYQEQVEDLRRDRDGWRQQVESVQRLLTDARQAAKQIAAPAPKTSWWKRLMQI